MSSDIRSHLAEFARRLDIPAAVGGVVAADGGLQFEVIGVCTRGSTTKVTKDDYWHIGSCAKSITASLYAILVERGDADWDAPISTIFADLAGDISPQWADRRMEELFLCESGMQANPTLSQMRAAYQDDRPLTDQRTAATLSAMRNPPKQRDKFVYSNSSYMTIGAAIDRLSGMPFEQALKEYLLEPLGITTLGYGPPDKIWGHKVRVPLGPMSLFKGPPADPSHVHSDNPAVLSSAGTMHLSMRDWAKFLNVFSVNGTPLLKPESVDYLLSRREGSKSSMTKGWGIAQGAADISYGMQGSNRMWAATALLDGAREKAAFMVCNDGRTRVLTGSPKVAMQFFDVAS